MTVSDGDTDASARRGDGAERETEGESLTTGELLTTTEGASRRETVRVLRDAEGPVPVARLVERLATRGHDVAVDELRPHQRKGASASLRYDSLPRLAEYHVVDFDPEADVVEPAVNFSRIEPHLPPATSSAGSREPYTDGGTTRGANARLEDDDAGPENGDATTAAAPYRAGIVGASVAGIAAVTASPLAVSALALGALVAAVLALALVADRVRYATRRGARSR